MDIVITISKGGWPAFLSDGAFHGGPDGRFTRWAGGDTPDLHAGDRVYFVSWGRLRGYGEIVKVQPTSRGFTVVVENGGALTVDREIPGFQGWRERDWDRADEFDFPDYATADVGRICPRAGCNYDIERSACSGCADRVVAGISVEAPDDLIRNRDRLAELIGKFPEVEWEAIIAGEQTAAAYGWLDTDRRDFVVLNVRYKTWRIGLVTSADPVATGVDLAGRLPVQDRDTREYFAIADVLPQGATHA